jgi:hypothetical protein
MRTALLASLAMLVAVPVGFAGNALADVRPVAGTLSIEGARGVVVVRGAGTVVGHLDRGELQVVDLSPNDAWTPKVNGVTKARTATIRGKDVNFFVPGGRYRISVKGDGVSLSARGVGVVTVKATKAGDGTIAVGDAAPAAIPTDTTRFTFGGGDASGG